MLPTSRRSLHQLTHTGPSDRSSTLAQEYAQNPAVLHHAVPLHGVAAPDVTSRGIAPQAPLTGAADGYGFGHAPGRAPQPVHSISTAPEMITEGQVSLHPTIIIKYLQIVGFRTRAMRGLAQ